MKIYRHLVSAQTDIEGRSEITKLPGRWIEKEPGHVKTDAIRFPNQIEYRPRFSPTLKPIASFTGRHSRYRHGEIDEDFSFG